MSEPTAQARVTILNERGLHARAAAKLVKLASRYDAEVTVIMNGEKVSGASIMGLMMLAAAPGCELELHAKGPEAREVIAALSGLVAKKFDED
ncbi:MAG: HPr family phosphocarrier protein [Kiloniellales bacterium]|jgi:phosphocarrier protein